MPPAVSNDLVMGLHWTPLLKQERAHATPANLDAICILLDGDSRRLEVIRPGYLKSANGSVVHTGDSWTGASAWDDERIFVFVSALPSHVHSLMFGVVSHDRPFSEVAGASCHISDARTEDELLRIDLTPLGPLTEYCIALLERTASGWFLRQQAAGEASLAEALSLQPPRGLTARTARKPPSAQAPLTQSGDL